jgi:hypothetical protein
MQISVCLCACVCLSYANGPKLQRYFEVFPGPIAAAFFHPAADNIGWCGEGACIPRTLIFQHRNTVPTVNIEGKAQSIDCTI